MFKDRRVLLCISGGIAAYKAAALTSTLVQQGASVDVMMTPEAERFIAPLTFSSLTARPVYTSLWDAPERIPHISLVREAQVAMLVPATANVIAKLAHGIADDIVTTALLAARIPVIVAPAMNDAMYRNDATQANLRVLEERGFTFVEPESGFLAERESGIGRLASEERLLEALEISLQRAQSLQRRTCRDYGGAYARGIRSGALRKQSIDGRDRYRTCTRSGSARSGRDADSRSHASRCAGPRAHGSRRKRAANARGGAEVCSRLRHHHCDGGRFRLAPGAARGPEGEEDRRGSERTNDS